MMFVTGICALLAYVCARLAVVHVMFSAFFGTHPADYSQEASTR
jgi:hypothetical protein